jgi:hypothetical protein
MRVGRDNVLTRSAGGEIDEIKLLMYEYCALAAADYNCCGPKSATNGTL